MIELKPCPFCGGSGEARSMFADFGICSVMIVCVDCRASSGVRGSTQAAAELWNMRTYQPEEIEKEFMRICEAQMEKES